MSKNLSKKEIEKFSRQIILKNIGATGQKKILSSKVLIVGMGGLGCPAAEFLTRSGIDTLGIADHDTVSLSNIHRQGLYNEKDINQSKVKIAKKKLNKINSKTKINIFFKTSLACNVPIIPATVPKIPSYSQFKISSDIVSS